MTGPGMPELLATMTAVEIEILARETFPDRIREFQAHGNVAEWLQNHADWERLLPKVPLAVLERMVQSRSADHDFPTQIPAPTENPLGLDASVRGTLSRQLGRMPQLLRERGEAYADKIIHIIYFWETRAWFGEVEGSDCYVVSVTLGGNETCDCLYHGEHSQCKHTAGFRERLLREYKDLEERREALKQSKEHLDPKAEAERKSMTEWIWKLQTIGKKLNGPDTETGNDRKQVVYVLQMQPGEGRMRQADLVPRTRTLTKYGSDIEGRDLRIVHDRRLVFNRPKYISEADVELITHCGEPHSFGWSVNGRGSKHLHPLLETAHGLGRLLSPDGATLHLDGDLWRLVSTLLVNQTVGQFQFSLSSLDRPGIQKELVGDWVVFGSDGNWVILLGQELLRLDSRTQATLFKLAENLPPVPLEALEQVRPELRQLSHCGVSVPPALLPPRVREQPLRKVAVHLAGKGVTLSMLFAYPSLTLPPGAFGEIVAFTKDDGTLAELERSLGAEADLAVEFESLLREGEVANTSMGDSWIVENPLALRVLALTVLPILEQRGWDIREVRQLDAWKRRTGTFKAVGKSSGQDWFELGGVMDFDGIEIPLAKLVSLRGEIPLADGSIGEISRALFKRLDWIEKLGTRTEDGIRLRGFHSILAQELLDSGMAQVQDSKSWNWHLSSAMQTSLEATKVPASLHGVLRPYQKQGLDWLVSLRQRGIGGILADDMGLGKTVQVIAHLCHLFEADPLAAPALVVGPASVVGNWISEIERFAPHLHTRLLHGTGRDELRDTPHQGPTVFVTTYGILPRELEWMRGREFSLLVLDESQAIRNPATITHECCLQLRAAQKLCLTGTPIENSLSDLWAQFSFLNPGLLGSRTDFLAQFDTLPGEKPDLSRLRLLTAPFWLRRTKSLVARDLPPREDIVLPVAMDPKQAALYQRQLLDYQKNLLPQIQAKGLDEGGRFQVFTALLRLRQIACAPELAGHKGPSAKLDLLTEKLVEDIAEGHRALVFSSFTSLLDLVEKRLHQVGVAFLRIDGSTPAAERTKRIKRFQTGDHEPVFLVSLKAGGAGINLTAADDVFLLDPWWNPAAEEQAAARAHRIGQVRPVTLYRMVSKGTIEERVMALAKSKAELASELFDAGDTGGAALTVDVVRELLR